MQPAARQKQEYLIRTLNALRIPYEQCDVSMDEESKKVWRRKGRTNGQLPGFLVDGEVRGGPGCRACQKLISLISVGRRLRGV